VTDSASVKLCPCPEHEGPNPLPVSAFGKDRSNRDGLKSWCKTCRTRAYREWRQANPEIRRAADRRWKKANPGKLRAAETRYRATHPEYREKARGRARQWKRAFRNAVLDHYGRSCACCGATENLTIDHVNGGGKAHRIELFGRDSVNIEFYRWLIEQNFPPGFQVLCKPCNSSKGEGTACHLVHAATRRCPTLCP
jgi:hypothetical protein